MSRRLLYLTPFAPRFDLLHGGGRAAAQLIDAMARRHRVAVLYLREPGHPPMDEALRERCDLAVEVPCVGRAESRPRRLARRVRLVLPFLGGVPRWASYCAVEAFGERLAGLARSWRPDVVQVEYHVMGQYLAALDGVPTRRVLTQYEPGVLAATDRWRSARGLERLQLYFDLLAWRRFEPAVIRRVHAVVVFTERDRQAIAPAAAGIPVVRIPLGTPIPGQALDPAGVEPPRVLFVGNFNHPPNVDAARRLANDIFPLIRARHPQALLQIVGDAPPSDLANGPDPAILVTGRVPEVGPYLDAAAVVVAPLRQGGGMRVKVLEALAAGKAVIASPLAAEGIGLADGEQVVLAERDEDFARAIGRLLDHPAERIALAGRARAWAAAHLGWETSVAAYERLHDQLLAR